MDHNSFPLLDAENDIRIQETEQGDLIRVVVFQRGVRIGAGVGQIIDGSLRWGSSVRARKTFQYLEDYCRTVPGFVDLNPGLPEPEPVEASWSEWWPDDPTVRLVFSGPVVGRAERLRVEKDGVVLGSFVPDSRIRERFGYVSGWRWTDQRSIRILTLDNAVRRALGLPLVSQRKPQGPRRRKRW